MMKSQDYIINDTILEQYHIINAYVIEGLNRLTNTKSKHHTDHRRKETRIPISEKVALTLDEAAEYSNIGIHRLREMINDKKNDMFIRVGAKNLVKRRRLDEFLENAAVI